MKEQTQQEAAAEVMWWVVVGVCVFLVGYAVERTWEAFHAPLSAVLSHLRAR